jgi:2-polyprenyl-3-methyl-5-hydroxy-6-metoxy-1,4-benzoquinol methylase
LTIPHGEDIGWEAIAGIREARRFMLNLNETSVAQHYNESIFDYESVRLHEHSPIEFAITARYLNRWIPDRATVVDIGVGVGHYAELLAKRNCSLYLVDIAQRLLDTTYARLKAANLEPQVIDVQQASATQVVGVESAIADAVLLLGPLYHLCSLEARQTAVREAARLLKPNGLLFAAGINRLAYFRELFRSQPKEVVDRQAFHQQFLQDGNVDPDHAPPLGYGHLTTQGEFCQLFEPEFDQIAVIGVESFTAPFLTNTYQLGKEEIEAWLDLIEATGQTPEGLAMSDHFLYVGNKKK